MGEFLAVLTGEFLAVLTGEFLAVLTGEFLAVLTGDFLLNRCERSDSEPVLRFLEAGLFDFVVQRLECLQKRCHFVEWPGVRSVA